MDEAIRTAPPEQEITMVTDANPSYPAGIHFINQSREVDLSRKKVIGLQNLDELPDWEELGKGLEELEEGDAHGAPR